MEYTISDKYQVVIPKEARKKLGLKPGQKITLKSFDETSVTFERQLTMQELLDKGRGTLKNTPWQKANIDAAVWIRQQRDQEDTHRNKIVGRE